MSRAGPHVGAPAPLAGPLPISGSYFRGHGSEAQDHFHQQPVDVEVVLSGEDRRVNRADLQVFPDQHGVRPGRHGKDVARGLEVTKIEEAPARREAEVHALHVVTAVELDQGVQETIRS
jgi:hypothetical protein